MVVGDSIIEIVVPLGSVGTINGLFELHSK